MGDNTVSKGKKLGCFALGLTPTIMVLIWQNVVVVLAMGIYMFLKMQEQAYQALEVGTAAYDAAMEQITTDFIAGTPMAITTFIIYVGYLPIFGLWYYQMYCKKKQSGSWMQVVKPKRIITILGAGLFLQIGVTMVLTVILPLLPKLYESYMGVMDSLGNDSVFMVICVCILAPVGEEFIFRGLTFRTLRRAVPWQLALVLQAVLFGVYHMNLVQGTYAAVLGLAMGYLAYKYGSVVPGILLHMTINSSSYLVSYVIDFVLGRMFPEELIENTLPANLNFPMSLIGVVSLGLAVILLAIAGKGVEDKGRLAELDGVTPISSVNEN
jgi:hypothetical protein